jgi:hypothetical protein
VDVEFEEMVELIGEGGDGAGYCFGDAVVEGERARCLVASVEWNVLELAETVGDLFALLLAMLLWIVSWASGASLAYMFSFPVKGIRLAMGL